jgi:hypothetical protein
MGGRSRFEPEVTRHRHEILKKFPAAAQGRATGRASQNGHEHWWLYKETGGPEPEIVAHGKALR